MTWFEATILVYFIAMNGVSACLLALSALELTRARVRRWPGLDTILLAQESTPPISIIAPAFNEGPTVVESIRAFLHLEYANLTVIVVNDGSTDDTMPRLRQRFELERVHTVYRREFKTRAVRGVYRSKRDPRLIVVDKDNGGKADALNAGINVARTPLVCCVDADSLIEQRALLRMVEPFIYDPKHTVAVGGTIRVANGALVHDGRVREMNLPSSWLARFQVIEYLRAFLFTRLGLNRFGGNLIVSGALGLFRRDILVELGGYARDTVGEDMELIVRTHRHMRERRRKYRVVYVPEPVCFTEAPESWRQLAQQRNRWQRGLCDSLLRHRRMLMNPRYGRVGLLAFPLYVLFELCAPVIELFGYVYFAMLLAFGDFDPIVAGLFFTLAFLIGVVLSLQALILDDIGFNTYSGIRTRLTLFAAILLENLGYRQFLLIHRLKGMWDYTRNNRTWGEMRRKGFGKIRDVRPVALAERATTGDGP